MSTRRLAGATAGSPNLRVVGRHSRALAQPIGLALRIVRNIAVVAVWLVVVLAAGGAISRAATASSVPRVDVCGLGSAVRPSYVLLGCGDGGQYLANVRWSSWAGWYAHGTAVWWQNLCTPDCAAGHFRHDRVEVTLSRPRACRRPSVTLFTRMTLRGAFARAKIPSAGAAKCP